MNLKNRTEIPFYTEGCGMRLNYWNDLKGKSGSYLDFVYLDEIFDFKETNSSYSFIYDKEKHNVNKSANPVFIKINKSCY